MKKILIVILLCSLKGYSQDLRLFEHPWYLHDLVINGGSNIPPVNSEIPYVPLEFSENGDFYTGMCGDGGSGQLAFNATIEFDIVSLAFLLGGCHVNIPYNQNYSDLYNGFWEYLQGSGFVPYEITENGQNRTLVVTGPNGNHAIYGDEVPLSVSGNPGLQFSIYPTVVKNSFYINAALNTEIQKITIYDSFGQTVLSGNRSPSEIDVSHLQAGLYFVSIRDEANKLSIQKFIKH